MDWKNDAGRPGSPPIDVAAATRLCFSTGVRSFFVQDLSRAFLEVLDLLLDWIVRRGVGLVGDPVYDRLSRFINRSE